MLIKEIEEWLELIILKNKEVYHYIGLWDFRKLLCNLQEKIWKSQTSRPTEKHHMCGIPRNKGLWALTAPHNSWFPIWTEEGKKLENQNAISFEVADHRRKFERANIVSKNYYSYDQNKFCDSNIWIKIW